MTFPCGPAGEDHLFVLDLPERSRVDVEVLDAHGRPPVAAAAFDACAGDVPALVCDGPFSASPLRVEDHPAGRLFIAVRTPVGTGFEPYTVRVTVESLVRACNDGLDNDDDGLVDDFDPGCAWEFDEDETHYADSLPACGDGVDNDGDGHTDYPDDLQCRMAGARFEEPSCDQEVPLTRVGPEGGRFPLHTEGRDHYQATCGNPAGPEQVLAVDLPVRADLTLTVENNDFDTVVFVRSTCDDPGAEVGCNDDTNGLASEVRLTDLPAGTYFVFLDGYAGAAGNADVVVTVTPRGEMP